MVFASRPFRRLMVLLLVLSAGVLISPDAWAQAKAKTLGEMTNNVYDSLISLQFFLSLLSYILGTFFFVTGLKMLRDHVDDPGRNPLKNSMLRLGAAAFFIFSPTLANMLINALGGGASDQLLGTKDLGGYAAKGTGGDGLEGALQRFVVDFGAPFLDNLLPFFAYVAGVILMLVGLKRLALASGDGPQAPGGLGTIGTFIVAAGLMSFGYIMYLFQGSIFGVTDLYANSVLNGDDSELSAKAGQMLWGVFIFLRIVGYISVLRGLFMLRAYAEGGNVSLMAVGTHMVAGSLLANGGYFVETLQNTFLGSSNASHFVFNPINS